MKTKIEMFGKRKKEKDKQLLFMYEQGFKEGQKKVLRKIEHHTSEALQFEFKTSNKGKAFIQLVNAIRSITIEK